MAWLDQLTWSSLRGDFKLKRIAFSILPFAVLCCALEAQSSPPSVALHGNCTTNLPRFEDWYQTTRLPYGEPYVATAKRKLQVLENYPKLKLQMSLEETEKILGKPDFAIALPAARLATAPEPTDKHCNNEVAFILKKTSENATDTEDVAVYLSFSRDGRLYWLAPQNLPALKPLGSATGEVPLIESQTVWKEYVFADDGFAITLPHQPTPHTDPTLPDFTVYSVSLPDHTMLSLRVSHQNRDCAATLGELKEGALRAQSGIDPSSVKNPSIAGNQGLEYEYTANGGRVQLDRFYCVSGKFYAFSTGWFGSKVLPASLESVFGSFRLLDTKPAVAPQ